MPPQIVKAEALHQVAILAVRLAIALYRNPCPDRGWANVVFDQHGCRARTFPAELDTWENVITVVTTGRLLAPRGKPCGVQSGVPGRTPAFAHEQDLGTQGSPGKKCQPQELDPLDDYSN